MIQNSILQVKTLQSRTQFNFKIKIKTEKLIVRKQEAKQIIINLISSVLIYLHMHRRIIDYIIKFRK